MGHGLCGHLRGAAHNSGHTVAKMVGILAHLLLHSHGLLKLFARQHSIVIRVHRFKKLLHLRKIHTSRLLLPAGLLAGFFHALTLGLVNFFGCWPLATSFKDSVGLPLRLCHGTQLCQKV